jgi:tRNA dimethylallyltransferase
MNRDPLGKDEGDVVVVAGPTASGKSAAALAIAEAFTGTVINADSMQLYRELAVLTARPGPELLARAPHRLYGVLPAAERGTAGRWLALAHSEIAMARAVGRLPILVGGTGMYLKMLAEGLAPVPAIPSDIRAAARARLAELGAAALHDELARRDPIMAGRLQPSDTQRVLRAYEVVTFTGTSLAEFQRQPAARPKLRLSTLLLLPPRASLVAAIGVRATQMVVTGAVAEVEALLAQRLDPSLPAMKALGVRTLGRHLAGEINRDEAIALLQRETCAYAKRQITWFRHQMPEARVWKTQFSESLMPEMFSFIRQ